ncbi:MAG: flavin reductase family protein [Muribaculaceae bacterium]|nr:flavin reductase family protein [Muribaculaceae bacterium]
MKLDWKPGTMLYPLPAVIVSCGDENASNLITVAWTGTVCTSPAMLYISVRPERYSYDIIRRAGEFTVNLTTAAMARATDLCGVRSGRDTDKWAASGLHPVPGVAVACPSVLESPVSLECKVSQILELGSHHMFLAEVVNVRADDAYLDADGRFDLAKAGLLNYSHGHYYCQGRPLGHFGFSVRRKPLDKKSRK